MISIFVYRNCSGASIGQQLLYKKLFGLHENYVNEIEIIESFGLIGSYVKIQFTNLIFS